MATQAKGNVPAPAGSIPAVEGPGNPVAIAPGAAGVSLMGSPTVQEKSGSTCVICSAFGPLVLFGLGLWVISKVIK